MTKAELIDAVAREAKITKAAASRAVHFITETIMKDLKKIATDKDLRNNYQEKGPEFMRTHWSGEKNIHKLIEIYKAL